MATFLININGQTKVVESARPLSGGVSHMEFRDLVQSLANVTAPNVNPTTVAVNATANLVSVFNTLRPTNDATIANAIINMPTSPTDGELVVIATTAAISNVALGSASNAQIVVPAVNSLTAGQRLVYRWTANANTTGQWLIA